jgi:hypothetical protein
LRYGKEDPTLKLDTLMIQAAALRSKVSTILSSQNTDLVYHVIRLRQVAAEGQALLVAIAAWTQDIPVEWRYSIRPTSDSEPLRDNAQYNGSTHSYTTLGHAGIWNRYRAVRILVNSIQLKILSALTGSSYQELSADSQLYACQESIQFLAIDLCRGVQVFFSACKTVSDESGADISTIDAKLGKIEQEISPKMAVVLTWPLIVAIGTKALPEAQENWLKCRLKTIASTIGADVLHSIAQDDGSRDLLDRCSV